MTISDIVTKINFLTKTDTTNFPAADMLVLINNAYERVVSLIIKADNKWQWDDTNQTDLPIATTAIVSGQKDYSLASSHLKIVRVRIKNSSGVWNVLQPIDQADQDYSDIEDSTVTGTPIYYDKSGISVFLSPTPSYSQSASLELTFQRAPVLFTSSDVSTGTKQPGFNSLYHDLIPLWVSYDYWLVNDASMTTRILDQINKKEDSLIKDYNMRGKDDIFRMRPNYQDNR